MSVVPVVKYPDPVLRETSVEVKEIDDEIRKLIKDMSESMYAAEGAGLAAVQVGRPIRIFVVDAMLAGEDPTKPPLIFINPEVIGKEGSQDGDEGCLSFPGIFVPIARAERCTVRAMDLEGKAFEMTGEGILARAFQHEMDHLNATLIIDHVGRLKKRFIDKKMRQRSAEEQQQTAT